MPQKPKHPKAKFKTRPGLALIVGRAIVVPEYYASLKDNPAGAASDIGASLSETEAQAIARLDWSQVDQHVAALRALLPEPERQPTIRSDAAGW